MIMIEKIEKHLSENFPWRNQLHWYPSIDSTNLAAKQMAVNGAPHGTVLIAGHQTAGRGRLGRSFQSPEGMGIYMSILLRPNCLPEKLMTLTCQTAVALCDAIEHITSLRPNIKWTNDIVYKKRKVSGILTELSVNAVTGLVDFAIIGIGINCNQKLEDFPEDLQSFAGSLYMMQEVLYPHEIIIAEVLSVIFASLQNSTDFTDQMNRYRADCITIGTDISLLRGEKIRHGHALDVDNQGALIVQFPDGSIESVNSGEVSVRGMYGYQ